MGLLRLSVIGIGAVIACVALLLASAVTARAAGPACPSSAMYVAAHADDTLLFQSPSLLRDVRSGRCVRTVFLTAGDAGKNESYWGEREEGAEAGYAEMLGVANQWTGSELVADGHSIHLETLTAQPQISIAYMRLPDGGSAGGGSPAYGNQSLAKLWKDGNPGEGGPTIGSIEAVDDSEAYDYDELVDAVAALIDSFAPTQLATQDYTLKFAEGDHADHVAAGYFAREGSELYDGSHRLLAFQGYDSADRSQNVFGDLLAVKSLAFYSYGEHDSEACESSAECAATPYEKWLLREYVEDTETVGAVAHAGYPRIASAAEDVNLDGAESSGESGAPLVYAWTQTGGPKVALAGAGTDSPSFVTPSHPTLLTFSLTVADGSVLSEPDYVKVRVPGGPDPGAVSGPDQAVDSGAGVTLDGSESWDPNSLPLQFAWIQTAGPVVALSGASSEKPTFIAPTGPATLKFSLTVTNGTQTSGPATVTVDVNGIAPGISSAGATSFRVGEPQAFTVVATGAPTPALTRSGALPGGIDFTDNGDGTATLSGVPAAGSAPPGSSRAYPITFAAVNELGDATQSFTLTVVGDELPPSDPSGDSGDAPRGAGPPTDPGVRSQVKLSSSKVRLLIGRSSRHVVKVLGAPRPWVECSGALPPGASCRVTALRNVVIEGSKRVKRAGTYRLTVRVVDGSGTFKRPLIVHVRRP